LKPESVSTKQERIATLARENPAMAFTSLNHYLDVEWMEYAFKCTRKDGAVGVDGQTAEGYAANLRHNLLGLIDRLKSGRYRAPPVRRHYIDKAGGGQRGPNRMRESRSCGSVRAEDSNVLGYSEVSESSQSPIPPKCFLAP